MAPATRKRLRVSKSRQPLAVTQPQQNQVESVLVDIFNSSQHVRTAEAALSDIKKLYKQTEYKNFEKPFCDCFRKLLQSPNTIYFKTCCEFLCKFLNYVVGSSEEARAEQNTDPKSTSKRKSISTSSDDEVDELLGNFTRRKSIVNTSISDHDRLISSCIDIVKTYMQVVNEDCRSNATQFIIKFTDRRDSLDDGLCEALQESLSIRIRDRKPMIRAQAVLASRILQDNEFIKSGFRHHFQRDPELIVRKALLQVMDTKVFGYDFLVDSTQEPQECMRRKAFQRLGELSPSELSIEQLHRVIHNGLNERERQASYSFKTHTLETWLSNLYDGTDLHHLLKSFNALEYPDDVSRLLEVIYSRDLANVENNGSTTRLHHVVESFREKWLTSDNACPSLVNELDERVFIIWSTMVKFCKTNQNMIKPVKVRSLQQACDDSIEKILDSQERADELVELYERLTPDLVNLADFLQRFVHHAEKVIKVDIESSRSLEFMYQTTLEFILTYEVGDQLERKLVHEVIESILKESSLTEHFENFIPPLVKCLFKLVYSSNSNSMINYISELINNVRSHLEDLMISTQTPIRPTKKTRSSPRMSPRMSMDMPPPECTQQLETRIANLRVELEELKDALDEAVKQKDFDQAKKINCDITDRKSELNLLHNRRCSIASDVSSLSIIADSATTGGSKFSSTMIQDSFIEEENNMLFKHHPHELVKCLQMYFGCLQNVNVTEVPTTMLNHLKHLNYESLDTRFKGNAKVRNTMIACNGITAVLDKTFAQDPLTIQLLFGACIDPQSIENRTIAFRCIVDIVCQHQDLEFPHERIEKILRGALREYGKFHSQKNELDYITSLVEGACKLHYLKRMSSPPILSHLICWWYHPKTPSRLKQFIGVFLPLFVEEIPNDEWLRDLLADTFVTSIEYLHDYILGPGHNTMASGDMLSLINFLSNLIPVSFHNYIQEKVDIRIDEVSNNQDLIKYLRQSKKSLTTTEQTPPPIRD